MIQCIKNIQEACTQINWVFLSSYVEPGQWHSNSRGRKGDRSKIHGCIEQDYLSRMRGCRVHGMLTAWPSLSLSWTMISRKMFLCGRCQLSLRKCRFAVKSGKNRSRACIVNLRILWSMPCGSLFLSLYLFKADTRVMGGKNQGGQAQPALSMW